MLCISVERKATIPLRIGLNIMYHTPMPEFSVGNLLEMPLTGTPPCLRCDRGEASTAVIPAVHSGSDTEEESGDPDSPAPVVDVNTDSDTDNNALIEEPLL